MNDKKTLCVVAASALMLGSLQSGCGSSGDSSPEASPARRSSTRRAGQEAEKAPTLGVDLESLLTEVPEYEGRGRNLFAFGAEPRPSPSPSASLATTTVPRSEPSPRVTQQPAAPPINLKFAGFVETPQPGGEKKKYAVFLSGAEILTGAEGDLVANRYEIVHIGLESVTLSMRGSDATQKIPLSAN